MAALDATKLTLLDWATRRDPSGGTADIVEMLAEDNAILDDMVWKEGNLTTGERVTLRVELPQVYYRLLNQGVLPSKSTTAQIDEQTAMLEAYSQVDEALAALEGDSAAVRLTEQRAQIQAMMHQFATTLFYGSAITPEQFIGLAPRYNALTSDTNSDYVIDGGGTGSTDNTSIWVIQWSQRSIYGIFNKGSKAGLEHRDLGKKLIQNAGGVTGALMEAYVDHYIWNVGIALADYRHAVRIANIDVSQLEADSGAADLRRLMADAEERLPQSAGGRRGFYMNRTVRRNLRHQTTANVSSGGGITFENVAGKRVMFFGETPVRTVDALLNTEDVVA